MTNSPVPASPGGISQGKAAPAPSIVGEAVAADSGRAEPAHGFFRRRRRKRKSSGSHRDHPGHRPASSAASDSASSPHLDPRPHPPRLAVDPRIIADGNCGIEPGAGLRMRRWRSRRSRKARRWLPVMAGLALLSFLQVLYSGFRVRQLSTFEESSLPAIEEQTASMEVSYRDSNLWGIVCIAGSVIFVITAFGACRLAGTVLKRRR